MGYSNDVGPVRPSGRLIGCAIFVILFVVATIGAFTWNSWGPPLVAKMNQPQAQTPVNNTPVQPGQTNVEPTNSSPTVPTGPRKEVRVCFVTFVSYDFAAVLQSMDNPRYKVVLVPLLFQAEENGPYLTKGEEFEQAEMLKSGECDILLTTSDALAAHPSMGKGIAVWDRSHGADQIWLSKTGRTAGCLNKTLKIVNDLKGCVLGVTGDSVSETYGLSFLKYTGMTTFDLTFDTNYGSPDELVQALNDNKVDAIVCWEPSCPDPNDNSVFKLTSTKDTHTIYDVVIVSPSANQNKKPEVTEVLADMFAVQNMFLNDPNGTAEKIAQWQYIAPDGTSYNTNWWTGINPGTAYSDMEYWGLNDIAIAKFDQNLVYIDSQNLWEDNLNLMRKVLEWGGSQLEVPFEANAVIDTSYLQALASRKDLYPPSGKTFPDNSFSPFPPDDVTLSGDTHTIAEFACPNVYFGRNAVTIPEGSDQYKAFADCMATLNQLAKEGDILFELDASAANPDPLVFGSLYAHCGEKTDEDYCYKIAKDRAAWARTELSRIGFDMSRVTVTVNVAQRTSDQEVMSESRFIVIKIVASGA